MAAQFEAPDFRIPPEELRQLYQRYRDALRRFFRSRRPGGVDDLMQVMYLQALSSRPSEAVRDPLQYLFGIAQNVLHAEYRQSLRERHRFVSVDPSDLESLAEGIGFWCVADEAASELLQQRLEDALARLPRTWQVAFLRSRRDGWSYQQIAKELNVTSHAVKKYIVKALARLRAELRASEAGR